MPCSLGGWLAIRLDGPLASVVASRADGPLAILLASVVARRLAVRLPSQIARYLAIWISAREQGPYACRISRAAVKQRTAPADMGSRDTGPVAPRGKGARMCQTKAQGGRRCLSHTVADWDGWRERREAVGPGVSETVEGRYALAVHRVAEVSGGTTRLTGRLADLDAGAPARGDDRAVIEAAVAGAVAAQAAAAAQAEEERAARAAEDEDRRAAFTRAVEAGEAWEQALREGTARRQNTRSDPAEESPLARALHTGEPVQPAPSPSTAPAVPLDESPLARALRTDEPIRDDGEWPEPDETIAYGSVIVPALQRSLVEGWAHGHPVEVTVYPDSRIDRVEETRSASPAKRRWSRPDQATTHEQRPRREWLEYDAATGGRRDLDASYRGWADERAHATIVVTDAVTGEQRALRAIQDPTTGTWEIQGPQYREGSR